MVLGSVFSVQLGAALATGLFDRVGPAGAVLLRSALGGLVMILAARGSIGEVLRGDGLRDVLLFAVALAGMNLCFYAALQYLALGVTVTLQFVGPLGVAVFGSHRRRDLIWALVAAAGIVLLSSGGGGIDALGAGLALAGGGFWAAYILQSARVGARHPGLGGLAVAMAFAALFVLPFGVESGGAALLVPSTLAIGLGVGLLNSAIPYTLEMGALRRLPQATFGVLMSLEPAVAALVGLVVLSQDLSPAELVAIALVVIASAGALRSASTPVPRDG